jgi:hypothetical protein
MVYLKCALVGVVTGVGTAIAWASLRLFFAFRSLAAIGSGGLGAVAVRVSEAEIHLSVISGFVLGFYLMWRRQRVRVGLRKP